MLLFRFFMSSLLPLKRILERLYCNRKYSFSGFWLIPQVKLKSNWGPLFLKLDTKNKILLAAVTLEIFSILSCKSYATELQDSNKTSVNNPDFYPQYKKTTVSINGFKVLLALASTDEQRIKGLSGLEKLNENEGMLFLFDQPSKQGFWMNEMKFPIDIIWLDSNSRVIHTERNLEPCRIFMACHVYTPQVDSLYVIELRSGFTNDHSIKNGTIINLNLTQNN